MSYTPCRIGGVDVFVSPDIREQVQPYGQVVPALDGTMYVSVLVQNPANLGSLDTLQISSLYAETSIIEDLREMARAREVVSVTGVPGIAGTDSYFITGFSQNPDKPAVVFPGDDLNAPTVRHTWNMSLTKVTSF